MNSSFKELDGIWNLMGFSELKKKEKRNLIAKSLEEFMQRIVLEENKKMEEAKLATRKIYQLAEQLNIECLPTIGIELADLEKKIAELQKEKKDRIKLYKKLKADDKALTDYLCVARYYLPSGLVPTRHQLGRLGGHIKQMKEEKASRLAKFTNLTMEIANLTKQIGKPSQKLEELKLKMSNVSLPMSRMIAMEQLLAKTENKYTSMREGMEKLRGELAHWRKKCFIKANDDRRPVDESEYTIAELFEMYEMELFEIKETYTNNYQIIDMMVERNLLFQKMIEFEKRANDPKRFLNRGGKLLREEKERKALHKELKKIENNIKKECSSEILNEIKKTWEKFEEEKEREREERKKAKKQVRTSASSSTARVQVKHKKPWGASGTWKIIESEKTKESAKQTKTKESAKQTKTKESAKQTESNGKGKGPAKGKGTSAMGKGTTKGKGKGKIYLI